MLWWGGVGWGGDFLAGCVGGCAGWEVCASDPSLLAVGHNSLLLIVHNMYRTKDSSFMPLAEIALERGGGCPPFYLPDSV
jgi:hypothetical protein